MTLYEEKQCEHILCWVSDSSKGYVDTKPMHESYTPYKGDKEIELHSLYPKLEGGLFFGIDCIPNFELIRELCSFGSDLIVLSPNSIKKEIIDRIYKMNEKYKELVND